MNEKPSPSRIAFADGWRWLAAGWASYRRHPFLLIGGLLSVWLVSALLGLVPWLGAVLPSLAGPFLTVGLMALCRTLDARTLDASAASTQAPLSAPASGSSAASGRFSGNSSSNTFGDYCRALCSGFTARPLPLLALGVVNLLAALGSLAGLALVGIDGPAVQLAAVLGATAGSSPANPAEASILGLLGVVLLTLLVSLILMYTALLIAWRNFSLGKALFFSLVAAGRAWRGLLGLFVATLLFTGLLPALVLTLLVAFLGVTQSMLLFLLVVTTVLVPTMISAIYTSYRAVLPEAEVKPNGLANDQ